MKKIIIALLLFSVIPFTNGCSFEKNYNIVIDDMGELKFMGDEWRCLDIQSDIGLASIQIVQSSSSKESKGNTTLSNKLTDSSEFKKIKKEFNRKIKKIFSKIIEIDKNAREYLAQNVPKKEQFLLKDLINPTIFFLDEDPIDDFSIWYNCSDDLSSQYILKLYEVKFVNSQPTNFRTLN